MTDLPFVTRRKDCQVGGLNQEETDRELAELQHMRYYYYETSREGRKRSSLLTGCGTLPSLIKDLTAPKRL